MPRPCHCRRVSALPKNSCFKPNGIPLHELEEVVLSLDGLEALRLADRMAQGGETLHDVAAPALKQLYEHGQLRHILTQPDDERMRALLEEAERLCTDLLEAR